MRTGALLLALGMLSAAPALLPAQPGVSAGARSERVAYPWMPDQGDGTYRNPIIFADYSDPDVVRSGERYVMVASSFAHTPAIPVLESKDLVNWTIVGHCLENLPSPEFDGKPQHGGGVWAPSIRLHKGEFYVYWGDPDRGIFMTKARRPEGPWTPALCVKEAKGWIDPCPLWDDDDSVYLVHAWAKSRAGFNSVLTVNRMNSEGTKVLDEGRMVFDGHATHPTIEGPKFYKRGEWYYIFAPAGGVKTGWQTVLRSRQIDGPYEDRIVLVQGRTNVNGPHQGAWVSTPTGEDWFIHFQDRGAYGRIVHLEPCAWKDDWPVIGSETADPGIGQPVQRHAKPKGTTHGARSMPQTSDEFDGHELGLQWQWEGNHRAEWYSLRARTGALRLQTVATGNNAASLWDAPNLLLQKFPAETFAAATRISFHSLQKNERAGLLVFGRDYAMLQVRCDEGGRFVLERVTCLNADRAGKESVTPVTWLDGNGARPIDVRVEVGAGAVCRFSYSMDGGRNFLPAGGPFSAREGMWVGAKAGLFALASGSAPAGKNVRHGYADFEFFHFK